MKCVLHIGTEKTGTTLLQNWLYANIDALSGQGVALSRFLNRPNNRDLVAYFSKAMDGFHRKHGIHDEAGRDRHFARFEADFAEEVRRLRPDHRVMILTSEHFHSRIRTPEEVGRIRDFLVAHFDGVRIICYLREQSAVRRSLYSTSLKLGGIMELREFQRNIPQHNHYYNYQVFLSKWIEAFGRDAVVARLYDRERFAGGDIRRDFIAQACGDLDHSTLDFDIASANESLIGLQAHAYRAVNLAIPHHAESGGVDQRNMLIKRAIDGIPELRTGEIEDDPDIAHEIHERFLESNTRIARELFGMDRLFDAPSPRPPGETAYGEGAVRLLVETLVGRLAALAPGGDLAAREVNLLRDVLIRSHNAGIVSPAEASTLMGIALRSRRDTAVMKRMIRKWDMEG